MRPTWVCLAVLLLAVAACKSDDARTAKEAAAQAKAAAADTVSQAQTAAADVKRSAERAAEQGKLAASSARARVDAFGQRTRSGVANASDALKSGAKNAGEALRGGADDAAEATRKGVRGIGQNLEEMTKGGALEGRVTAVGLSSLSVQPAAGKPVTLQTDAQTRWVLNGATARADAVAPGAHVKATYIVAGGTTLASEVQVLRP